MTKRKTAIMLYGLTMYVRRLSEGRLQMPHRNDDYKTCSLDYKGFLRLIL